VAFAHHDPAGEAEDAGEGNVQIDQDADPARLDHMPAEAREVAGPGATGVDAGGDRAHPREFLGVDAERGAAPVDMGVQVDQPRRHDQSGNIADGATAGVQAGADRGDLAAGEGDVGDAVDALRRVDHPSIPEHEIEGHGMHASLMD
jgi:hypothetical protein